MLEESGEISAFEGIEDLTDLAARGIGSFG